MDTIEQESPVGEAGATASPDTDSQDTQTDEVSTDTTQDVSDAQVGEEETESEILLAGKYKTPEELEKGYKELESKLGERNENSELTKMLEEQTGMSASQIRDYIAQQKELKLAQQYAQNPTPYLANEIQQLKSQIALQAEERELDKFLEKNPEYAPHRDKILKIGLNLEKGRSYEEIAIDYFGQARAQGQQDAYKKIDTKRMTQATGVSQAPPKGKLTPEDLDKMTAAEMEQVLPWADVSHRL